MPFKINEAAFKKQMTVNISRPQEVAPDTIPEAWMGTMNQGLPVSQIPFYAFPKCVYMHPNRPTRTIVHRNERHELVDEEIIPTEHLTKVIGCEAHIAANPGAEEGKCADCEKLLKEALGEGWVLKPYIPAAPPKLDSDLYGPRKK